MCVIRPTARRSYASAVLGVVILSVCPSVRLSVCHTRAFSLIQRIYRRYFYTTWKGNPSSQMWFFVQFCSNWQDFNWLKVLRGSSAIAELLVTTWLENVAVDRVTQEAGAFLQNTAPQDFGIRLASGLWNWFIYMWLKNTSINCDVIQKGQTDVIIEPYE